MSIINPRADPASSPCIGVCSTATGDAICRGCGRTLDEIREWNTYSRAQKIALKEYLVERLRRMKDEL